MIAVPTHTAALMGGCVDGIAACRWSFTHKCSPSAIKRSGSSSVRRSPRDNNHSVATILFLCLIAWAPAGAAHGAQTGQFLVAAPSSSDDDFARTVILLVHSGDEGAIGLIVNRPTTVPLSALFPDLKKPGAGSMPLYQGGPMRIGINGLVRSRIKPEHASDILPGIYLVSDRSQLKKIAAASPAFVRVYVGLCGWSAAQLRNELANGLWSIAAADAGTIFDKQPDSLWPRLAAKAKIKK